MSHINALDRSRELFGDDEDEEDVLGGEEAAGDDDEREEEEDDEFAAPPLERVLTFSIPSNSSVRPAESELWLVGLPLGIKLECQAFDPVEVSEYEKKAVASKNRSQYQTLKEVLTGPNIRHKKMPETDELMSNSKLVEFTDGSVFLMIGEHIFDGVSLSSNETSKAWLLDNALSPAYRVYGQLENRKIFKPTTSSIGATLPALSSSVNQKQKTKMTTVEKGAEAELKLRKQTIEIQHSMQRKQKRTSTLDADFLEND